MLNESALAAARNGDSRAFDALVAPLRRELRAACYRMSGSLADADDLLQESLVRAWRGLAKFEGRSSLRTWLHAVTWRTCIDAIEKGREARVRAMDLGPPAGPDDTFPQPRRHGWIEPCPAEVYADETPSPEARIGQRESVAFAFLAALQLLPPRQRAVLLLRDVLGWSAEECAEALETSVASANSVLQRARESLESRRVNWTPAPPDAPESRELIARYIAAWESADAHALESLLHAEATLAMPPFPLWMQGPQAIVGSIAAMVLTPEARGFFKFLHTEANGMPALAAYQKGADGIFAPAALHVLAIRDGRIAAIDAFLFPELFGAFDLPPRP